MNNSVYREDKATESKTRVDMIAKSSGAEPSVPQMNEIKTDVMGGFGRVERGEDVGKVRDFPQEGDPGC